MAAAENQIVVLGAGRSLVGGRASALASIGTSHRVLDWLLDAFAVLPGAEVFFVGGYGVREVEARYPGIRFLFNPAWAETGPAGSLGLMPITPARFTYVCYSDVVFRPELVRKLERSDSDVVIAVDSAWRVRYDGRSRAELDGAEKVRFTGERLVEIGTDVATSSADAEFAGLMRLSHAASERVIAMLSDATLSPRDGLPEIIDYLSGCGLGVSIIDVRGDWAELNARQDLARFVLGTKAESLERLRPLVRVGRISEQVSFSCGAWRQEREVSLQRVRDGLGDAKLIVRSSAMSEDGWRESAAGANLSLPVVAGANDAALADAVDAVFASYGDTRDENQILVQRMLTGVTFAGVVFTRTSSVGAPYYVIGFDSETGSTDSVTSGAGRAVRTLYLHRGAGLRPGLPTELGMLLEGVRELESLVGHNSLDIEFAFTEDGTLHVLQVRPIVMSQRQQPIDDEKIEKGLVRSIEYFGELQRSSPVLVGEGTQFSVMADWNPAEMIGVVPRRLAFSLYRRLITDEAWAQQRAEYGYRDVRPCNLIVDFLGHPYIDVRVDFNSFVPAALDDDLAAKLVNHYLAELAAKPELHDKVEFEVLITCLTFDFDARVERLRGAGLDEAETALLRESLADITRRGIARCKSDQCDIGGLATRRRRVLGATLPPLELAYVLLEDVRRVAIPLFSHLARHAFVAMSLLRSLRDIGVLDDESLDAFLASVRTIPSALQQDALAVAEGQQSWDCFVEAYGHLRPGSYDITSPSYGSAPEQFLRPMVDQARPAVARSTPWGAAQRRAVDAALAGSGLGVDCDAFEQFLRTAIEGREFAKFEFMKSVSVALESLAMFGASHGVGRKQLAQVRIEDLFGLRGASAQDTGESLRTLAREGQDEYYVSHAVCLPAQIFEEADFECFEQRTAEPNFITRKKVRARVVALGDGDGPELDLEGAIVAVSNADPGYDWLFTRSIGGLVTQYGGVNSHMAIRAAEFELPAAIGVGEVLFEKIFGARSVELDCGSRKIEILA